MSVSLFLSIFPFQSTCPARGTTLYNTTISTNNTTFQSTCPARGTTFMSTTQTFKVKLFQSTCPARGTTSFNERYFNDFTISIHVPREGHDAPPAAIHVDGDISIHVPREGHDGSLSRSPTRYRISIHVPREGHDKGKKRRYLSIFDFNPRAPRGARRLCRYGQRVLRRHFNPRAPRGARQGYHHNRLRQYQFQSTCPARGTTNTRVYPLHKRLISIHVPREGHDSRASLFSATPRIFQSTCPARGTTLCEHPICNESVYFNPRAPRGARQRR